MWPCVKATDSQMISRQDLAMRGEKPRKIQHHWVQDVVADNLREAMANDPLERSPEKLGKEAGVGRKSVERLRDGKNSTLTTLGAVADVLGIDPARLLVRKRTEKATNVKEFPAYPSLLDKSARKSLVRKKRSE